MIRRISNYTHAVCQHKVLIPVANLFTKRSKHGNSNIEITVLNPSSATTALAHQYQSKRSFSEHFPPYDSSKKKCPTNEIFTLVQHGSVEDLREWIETGGIDINCRDENLKTPLIVAAELNRVEMMKVLMEHGAQINAQDMFGDTALMAASRENCKKAVELLLQHQELQLDVKDKEEMTAADFTQDMDIDDCIREKSDVNFKKYKEDVLRPLQVQPSACEGSHSHQSPTSDKQDG